VLGIVEEVEATPEQKAIRELNAGVYCFDAAWLWPALKRLTPSPVKGEYYLTDTVGLAVQEGRLVEAVTTEDRGETMGVNTRVHLAEAERVLRRRIDRALMMAGVTLIDPDSAYVQPGVQVGRDSTLWPGVHLLGETRIGAGCTIGPGAVLTDVHLGDGCQVGAHAALTGVVAAAGTVFPPGVVDEFTQSA
jgi:bifunctional UDP-N-acetylglucosamine pyrophosphorylase/glucosamine-1-phosphate N-acetyltransferase